MEKFRHGFEQAKVAFREAFDPDTDSDSDVREFGVAIGIGIGIDGFELPNPAHVNGLITECRFS